jgi:protein Tob/BTG
MQPEVISAVEFIKKLMKTGQCLSTDQLEVFRQCLESVLTSRYHDHWFPDKPLRGSAYRCLRIVNSRMDHLLLEAARLAGVSESVMARLLPKELTMWVDPNEVSYRFGEEGSIGIIYSGSVVASSNSSPSSSGSSSPVNILSSSPTPYCQVPMTGYRLSPTMYMNGCVTVVN